jgi:hypothetical protein
LGAPHPLDNLSIPSTASSKQFVNFCFGVFAFSKSTSQKTVFFNRNIPYNNVLSTLELREDVSFFRLPASTLFFRSTLADSKKYWSLSVPLSLDEQ